MLIQLCLILLLSVSSIFACSRVFWNEENEKLVIRSMDLNRNDAAKIIISPRGILKEGNTNNSLKWKSKYGSVITTAFNTGVVDGINEQGLAAHVQYLKGTEYPVSSNLPQVGIHRWAEYFLDNCATIKEVIKDSKTFHVVDFKIDGEFWPIFIILEDKSGESVILEYIEGKLNIHCGQHINVATNDPYYIYHIENLKKYSPFGGTLPLPTDQTSTSRFVRASAFLISPTKKMDELIHILERKEDTWPTLWITISDLQNLKYTFVRTSDKKPFLIDLKKCNFSEGMPQTQINPYS